MKTAKSIAYEMLRTDILEAAYPPGHPLKEVELAERFGVSRTPVRQALRELATEGLVTILDTGRSYVSDITENQFEETFDVLVSLESYSAGLAALRISDDDLEHLLDLQDKMEFAGTKDVRSYIDLNSEFHKVIHRASENQKITDLLMQIVDFPNSLFTKFGQVNTDNISRALSEHRELLDALKARDREWASIAMTSHSEGVRRSFRALWEQDKKISEADPETAKNS